MTASQPTTGPGGRTVVWRVAWRERQDGALAIEREAWVDDEGEAERLADEVVRTGKVLGQVVLYPIGVAA